MTVPEENTAAQGVHPAAGQADYSPPERAEGLDSTPTPPQLGKRIVNMRTLISFGIALVLLVLAVKGMKIDLGKVKTVISHADMRYFLLAFVVYYISFPARGERWRLLMLNANTGAERERIRRYPLFDLTEILYLSWFANCVVPAKLGDLYRSYLARNCLGVSMSKTVGTVIAERMLDLLVLFPLLMLSTVWAFHSRLNNLPDSIRLALIGGLGLALLAVVAVMVLWRSHGLVNRLLPPRAAHMFTQFRSGALHSLRGNVAVPLGLTIFSWLMEGSRLYFVLAALGLLGNNELGISAAIFLALGSSVLTTLPITAGGVGAVETFLTGTLAVVFLHGVKDATSTAAAVAVLDRLISYVSLVVIGLIVYLFSKKTRTLAPASAAE